MIGRPGQPGHDGVEQGSWRVSDCFEHLTVQRAEALGDSTEAFPAPNRQQIHEPNISVCNHGRVRLWLVPLLAMALLALGSVAAPEGRADYTPWFAPQVGNATQVISVVGAGGSSAKIDV